MQSLFCINCLFFFRTQKKTQTPYHGRPTKSWRSWLPPSLQPPLILYDWFSHLPLLSVPFLPLGLYCSCRPLCWEGISHFPGLSQLAVIRERLSPCLSPFLIFFPALITSRHYFSLIDRLPPPSGGSSAVEASSLCLFSIFSSSLWPGIEQAFDKYLANKW